MPILKRAQAALDTLTTADIAIVRAMKKPPQGVRLIVESVCVLKVENSLFSFYSYLRTVGLISLVKSICPLPHHERKQNTCSTRRMRYYAILVN